MSGVIIALIVIVAVVVIAAAALSMARGRTGGRSLQRRFGPEYERTVARHDGDTKAAERELAARVERHGALRTRPLEPAERERFEARWAAAQERFVESPREAAAEADRLLGEVAAARGFPDGREYDEHLAALSVHHPHHLHGYRRLHRSTRSWADGTAGGGDAPGGLGNRDTEELREAMVEARALFDELVADPGRGPGRRDTAAKGAVGNGRTTAGARMPMGFTRHHAKGS